MISSYSQHDMLGWYDYSYMDHGNVIIGDQYSDKTWGGPNTDAYLAIQKQWPALEEEGNYILCLFMKEEANISV